MLSLALLGLLATKSVLVLDLTATDVPPATAKLLTELVSDAAAKSSLKTTSAQDLRRVAQMNAERADAGCDTSSCLAEMANAMGVDFVIFGDVGKLGSAYLVTLRLFDAKRADAVSRATLEGESIDDLRRGIAGSVRELLASVQTKEGPAPPPERGPAPGLWWPGVVTGAVGAVALAVGSGVALALDGTVADPGAKPADRGNALTAGQWMVGIAFVGGVAVAVGAGLAGAALVIGDEPAPTPAAPPPHASPAPLRPVVP